LIGDIGISFVNLRVLSGEGFIGEPLGTSDQGKATGTTTEIESIAAPAEHVDPMRVRCYNVEERRFSAAL
jgi:hypothetical protein